MLPGDQLLYKLETSLCHVLWQVGPQRPPGAVRGPGQPQETAGRHSGAQSGAHISDFFSVLPLPILDFLASEYKENRLKSSRKCMRLRCMGHCEEVPFCFVRFLLYLILLLK